eukprot:TRINITY_DN4056_c0_g1_i2.p1 TRINITY_DN4056_c0_g1~~TRINITY_DN4056_c0_g1_i2.p1  ORF type:complete len:120 (+),score=14.45 TRINITY_DN4056_c0_g1_i2:130-489(+)
MNFIEFYDVLGKRGKGVEKSAAQLELEEKRKRSTPEFARKNAAKTYQFIRLCQSRQHLRNDERLALYYLESKRNVIAAQTLLFAVVFGAFRRVVLRRYNIPIRGFSNISEMKTLKRNRE